MVQSDRWLLPEGIEDLLPDEAERVELLRRDLLTLYHGWGYELVIPPLIEFLDSLLVGSANDLEHHTFKLVDQISGRLIGVRADITPQVARIDAHRLKRLTPVRLCYFGPVLLTKARDAAGSRGPLQVGAELYGHSGIESDLEVLKLMLESLRVTGLDQAYLDLGHVGVFRNLIQQTRIAPELEDQLFDAIQRKAKVELRELLRTVADRDGARMLEALIDLNGGEEVLREAREQLRNASPAVGAALDVVERTAAALRAVRPELKIHFDLAELRGYRYHTGMVFAAYVPGYGQAVAQGGRYDDVGRVFGRARPATGYSMDLRAIIALKGGYAAAPKGVFAPAQGDADLDVQIDSLRRAGERVIRELPGQVGTAAEMGCNRVLVKQGAQWVVVRLENGGHG